MTRHTIRIFCACLVRRTVAYSCWLSVMGRQLREPSPSPWDTGVGICLGLLLTSIVNGCRITCYNGLQYSGLGRRAAGTITSVVFPTLWPRERNYGASISSSGVLVAIP